MRFSSSNQFSTTTSWGAWFCPVNFSIRKRRPSGATSYVRPPPCAPEPRYSALSKILTGRPGANADPGVTGTDFDYKRVGQQHIDWARSHNLWIIAWPCHTEEDFQALQAFDVDDVGSDYPSRIIPLLNSAN